MSKHNQQPENYEAYGEYQYQYQPGQAEETPSAAPGVEQVRRAHRKRRQSGFVKFLIVLVLVTIAVVVIQETVFRLETVYVIGNEARTPQQVVTASGLVRGRNMLGIEEEEVARALAKDHTIIFKGMQKEYPGTIYLYIEERKTVAAMQLRGMLYMLDAKGMVMQEQNTTALPQGIPVVTGFGANTVNVGQTLKARNEKQLEAYCEVMNELILQMYTDQITEINLADPDNLYLVTQEGVTVRLGDARYMRAKVGAVRTDMAYLRQLGKKGGILDVTTPEDAKYMPED